jgi:hypothetical protein
MQAISRDSRLPVWGTAKKGAAQCVVLAALLFTGCTGPHNAAPVDPARAHEALKTALESWKKGDAVAALQTQSPSITVQDFDWMGGARLVEYEVDGDGKAMEANLYVPVKLTLRTADGKELRKKVNYVVGTSPILTVFRDFH